MKLIVIILGSWILISVVAGIGLSKFMGINRDDK